MRGRNSRKNTLRARRVDWNLMKTDFKRRPLEPGVSELKEPGSQKK